MYLSGHDAEAAIAVWILDRPTSEEWRRFTLDVARVSHWASSPRPLALLIVEHFNPDAGQLAHLVQLIEGAAPGTGVGVVTVGALSRGFGDAFTGVSCTATFFEIDDAIVWLSAQRAEGLAPLRALWRQTNLSRPPERATRPA